MCILHVLSLGFRTFRGKRTFRYLVIPDI